jgi:hypothetical protein
METVITTIAFPGLVCAWLVFGYVAARNPAGLAGLWPRFRRWPLVAQLLAWVLLLPVVLAIWIAHESWPLMLRLPLVVGLAWASLYVMLPA